MVIQFQDAPVILVMGSRDSGKPDFISYLTANAGGKEESHKFETVQVHMLPVRLGDRLLYVATSPDIDDTSRSDCENLEAIARFLAIQYESGCKLQGIIFLHHIAKPTMQDSCFTHFHLLQEMCGEEALANVILLTTGWGDVNIGVGSRRHLELQDEHWETMIRHGSQARRFQPPSKSLAEALICRLLDKPHVDLKIQKDVMEEGKQLDETSAGRFVMRGLEERLASISEKTEKLKKDLELAARLENEERFDEIQQELERAKVTEQDVLMSRRCLQRDLQSGVREDVKEGKQKLKGGMGVQIFSWVVGFPISTATNFILPLLGVPVL